MTATQGELSREDSRVLELDGLRGAAILLVMVWHYFGVPYTPQAHTILGYIHLSSRMTWTGVDLFFVLSGYLISTNLMATRDRARYFRVFYTRRCARIIPLYFTILTLHSLVTLPTVQATFLPTSALFDNRVPKWAFFTFTQNIVMAVQQRFADQALGVTWSLAVEEQFYLLLPLLIWCVPNRFLPWAALGCVTTAVLTRLALVQLLGDAAAMPCYVLLPTRWDSLFLGVLAGWVLAAPERHAWIQRKARYLWLSLLVLLAGAGWMTVTARGVIMSDFVSGWGYTWIGLLYAVLLVLVRTAGSRVLKSLFCNRWLCRMGVLSYGMYLFHQSVHGIVQSVLGAPSAGAGYWLGLGVAVGLTVVLAEVSWRWLESPFIRLARRVRHAKAASPPVPSGGVPNLFSLRAVAEE
jgi:peptidoglycan/LPS O-acetylase OafA/YrhL